MTSDRRKRFDTDQAAWLRFLLAIAVLLLFVILYLALDSGSIIDRFRDLALALLPNFVTGLIAFIAVYGVLDRMRDRSNEAIQTALRQALSADDESRIFPNDIGQAAPFIRGLVDSLPASKQVNIDILAYTGATFCTAVLRDLLVENQDRSLQITMHVVDLDEIKDHYPSHWRGEISDTIARIQQLAFPSHSVELLGYKSHPFLLGMCLNDRHLLIAFPPWDKLTGKIADQALTYRYFERNDRTNYLFDLYWSWAKQPDQKRIVDRQPGTRGVATGSSAPG